MQFARRLDYSVKSFCLSFLLLFFWSLTFSNALAEISFTAALVLYLFLLVRDRRIPLEGLDKPSTYCLLGFASLAVLSYFWSEARENSFRGIFKVLQEVMVFVMVADIMKDRRNFGMTERIIFAVASLTVVNCIFQYVTGSDFLRGNEIALARAGKRIGASFRTYGQLGAFLIMVIPFIAASGLSYRKASSKIFPWSLALLMMTCLFFTRSRGAMCAFAAGVLVLALMIKNRRFILILLFLSAATVLLMPRSMLIHLDLQNKEQSLVERFYLWDRAVSVIKAKPLTGTGINTYLTVHAKYDKTRNWRVTDYYAHNGYLQMGAEIGLPALFLFLGFLFNQLRAGWKAACPRGSPPRWQVDRSPQFYLFCGRRYWFTQHAVGDDVLVYSWPSGRMQTFCPEPRRTSSPHLLINMKDKITILGISAYYHDSAACIVQDGRIIAAAQEERFTRIRHDSSFPHKSVEFCLQYAGLSTADIDYVVFYDKPLLKFERLLQTYMASVPIGLSSFVKAMPVWLKQKLWTKDLIRTDLAYEKGPVLFTEHHESHAASAFFPSPYDEAAVLTMDGVGEWATASYGIGKGNKLELLGEIHFPHSLGLLYSAFTYYAGFKVNSGEYKLMGLAPYGEPKYKDLILSKLIDLKEDGSFKLNMKYFDYPWGLRMTSSRFHKLFGGPPRKSESQITPKDMDIASSIQAATEEIMLKVVRHVQRETGMRQLCLAGGVALNCVANGRILREGPFENIWIQPAAGDAGGSLGAALFVWYHYLGNPRTVDGVSDSMEGSYLGPSYTSDQIKIFLDKEEASYELLGDSELAERVADLISQEKVIGWFQHRMEFGPRALGARSILGDARSPKMQEVMNLKTKFRESFRPFAPSILREKVSDYFEMNTDSPYMLLVAPVSPSRRKKETEDEKKLFGIQKLNVPRSEIPAVTHVDFSARVQTVTREHNPAFYDVLKIMDSKYDCPLVINTSFNVRGEPIVCTPDDAYRCFMRTNIDYLVLGNYLLEKKNQKPVEKDTSWLKQFKLD